jgi:hypothetical protein
MAPAGGRPAIPDAGGSRVLLVEDEPGLLRALLINLRAPVRGAHGRGRA